MSSAPNSAVEPKYADSNVAKPERMLVGFPWVSAIVLYTLSWGWSLLRPNTLYWDDWAYFESYSELIKDRKEMGGSPFLTIFELVLRLFGEWSLQVTTFIIFFLVGFFVFEIARSGFNLQKQSLVFVILVFLLAPVNHARISRITFLYTLSYFFFFLGWLILIRHKSLFAFGLSWVTLFVSLTTHSLLFFILLPFLHFVWLSRPRLTNQQKLNVVHFQAFAIAALPILYLVLRSVFWPPIESFQYYQRPTLAGFMTGLWPMLIGFFGLSVIWFRRLMKRRTSLGLIVLVGGFSITALALFPYFAAEQYESHRWRPAYISVFEFRADWSSRHQLLMPLGLALSVVGLNELLKWKGKNIVVSTVLVISVALNIFWGSQYFLQSHKQEQLVTLFESTKNQIKIASVEDQTKRFNGRESRFRSYEWDGFMTLAGIPSDQPGCEALPSGSVLTLKSDVSYLQALATRDLGLYFEFKPCSEVLAQNN
jgi:hypothetical protein